MTKELVKLTNLCFSYNGIPILHNINLTISQQDFLGIIGPNGSGKTTLLKIILGLLKPNEGEVKVFNTTPVRGRKNIGYVPQTRHFDKDFPINVFDVVLMGLLSKTGVIKKYSKSDKILAQEKLDIVGMLDFKHKQIGELSEGQKQRVYIARALISNPKLLLLDEPTASIDPCMQEGIYELLDNFKKDMAVVLVSHDIGVISRYVTKVACLNVELFFHDKKEIKAEDFEKIYKCPVDMIAHGVPHRVFKKHT